MVDSKLVQYLAELSKISMTPQELEQYANQLGDIIALMDSITDAAVTVTPSEGTGTYYSALRADTPAPSLPTRQLLQNAGQIKDTFFAVPKVVQ